jgi:hypothetical protein
MTFYKDAQNRPPINGWTLQARKDKEALVNSMHVNIEIQKLTNGNAELANALRPNIGRRPDGTLFVNFDENMSVADLVANTAQALGIDVPAPAPTAEQRKAATEAARVALAQDDLSIMRNQLIDSETRGDTDAVATFAKMIAKAERDLAPPAKHETLSPAQRAALTAKAAGFDAVGDLRDPATLPDLTGKSSAEIAAIGREIIAARRAAQPNHSNTKDKHYD